MSGAGLAPLLARLASQPPERPALQSESGQISYGALVERSLAWVAWLRAQGLREGDRLGLLAWNQPACLELMLATPVLGVTLAPLNFRLSAAELGSLLPTLDLALCLYDEACAPLLAGYPGPQQPLPPPPALSRTERDAALAALATQRLDPEAIALMLLTGGSTGLPKAACLPHRQLAANREATIAGWGLQPDDAVIQATPCFHAAVNVLALPLLQIGGRVVLMRQFEAGAYLRLLETAAITQVFLVPTMYQMLAEHADFARTDFRRVRRLVSGGAPCPAPVIEAFAARGLPLAQGYGMTEAGVNLFQPDPDHPLSVGRPLPGVELTRLAVEDGVGELAVRGVMLGAGYHGRAADWQAQWQDGWWKSGDLARVDAAGRWTIVGRRKEMFISGGENVYPAEVEAALLATGAVRECAVFGVADARWGEVGLAVLVPREPEGFDPQALLPALRSRLAGYKLPRHWHRCEALPRTGAGKIDKPALRRRYDPSLPSPEKA
ncbi:MAG TPA: AMP-binding protein [Nevskiaceae bacterium]|nr:AMP-binding protein [Nevskiaceae bacterium]